MSFRMRIVEGWLLAGTTALLMLGWPAVSQAEPLPEFYGVYVVDGGQIHEPKFYEANTKWIQVGPSARVIVFDKNIQFVAGPESVRLNRMSFLRNRIDLDGGGFNAVGLSGQRPNNPRPKVEANNRWHPNATAGRDIELRSKPVPNQPEMLVFVPREPLPEGHYAVLVNKKAIGSFRVGPEVDDKVLEASADCIDIESWATLSGRREQMLPCSGAKAGAAPASMTPEAKALDTRLTALLQKTAAAPSTADRVHTDADKGVSFSYPANFELEPKPAPFVAFLMAPGSGEPEAERTKVSLTKSTAKRAPTLQAAVDATLKGTQTSVEGSTIAGPISTRMGGADAQIFLVTGKEAGVLKQKAVTVAVVGNHVLGAVLHANPDTFDAAWDAYRRVTESYKVQ